MRRTLHKPESKRTALDKQSQPAPAFSSKPPLTDDVFYFMDRNGRGTGSNKFWHSKSGEQKMAYAAELVRRFHITDRLNFSKKAPTSIYDFIRAEPSRWDELGIPDLRVNNNKTAGNLALPKEVYDKADSFEIMDRKGRGPHSGEYWETVPHGKKLEYAAWLVETRGIKKQGEFYSKAPSAIQMFVHEDESRWADVGILLARHAPKPPPQQAEGSGATRDKQSRPASEASSKSPPKEEAFYDMDRNGRGAGSGAFWDSKTTKDKLAYSREIIRRHGITDRTTFIKAVPAPLLRFLYQDMSFWEELGIPDSRARNNRASSKNRALDRAYDPNDSFEAMDQKGRGNGSSAYWDTVPDEKKMEYAKWLLRDQAVDPVISRNARLYRKAPNAIKHFVSQDKSRGAELGLIRAPSQKGRPKPESRHRNPSILLEPWKQKPVPEPAHTTMAISISKMPKWQEAEDYQKRRLKQIAFDSIYHGYHEHLAAVLLLDVPVEAKKEADPKLLMKNDLGQTLLLAALSRGHERMADLILAFNQDVNVPDRNGNRALMYAASGSMIEKLKNSGADLDAVNNDGRTALIVHAMDGNRSVVGALLKLGADPTIKDVEGCTALHYAKACGEDSLAEQIKAYDVRWRKRNRRKTI